MRKAVLRVCVLGWLLCLGQVNAESSGGDHKVWIKISGNDVDATWTHNEQDGTVTGPETTPVYLSRTALYIVTAGCKCGDTNHTVTIAGKDKVDPADETRCGFTTPGPLTLTATCDTSSISVSTADVHILGLDILKVPAYIYADGTGSVPVQFRIVGYPHTGVTMSNSGSDQVEFWYQKKRETEPASLYKAFTYAVANGFAKGNGFGDQGNGTTDTYWLWVRNNAATFLSCDVDSDTTDPGKAAFVVTMHVDTDGQPPEIRLESIVKNKPEPWFGYAATDPDGYIAGVFGDKEVEVVVLNDEQFENIGLFKTATKQTKLQTGPDYRVMHVGTGCGSVWPTHAPCWTGTRHPVSACDGAWPTYIRHGAGHGFKPGEWEATHIAASSSSRKMMTRAWMSNDNLGRCWGDRFHLGNYANTVGVYFGFSYGTRAVTCLGGAQGMDLSRDGTGGSLNKCSVQMFQNGGTRKWSVWDVDSAGTGFGALAVGVFILAGALAKGGWDVVFQVSAWAIATFTPMEADTENRAEAAWHPVRIHKFSGGDGTPVYLSGTGPLRETTQTANDEQNWASASSTSFNMNADPVPASVGHVQTFCVAIGAGVCYETYVLIFGDEAGAWAGLEWPEADNNVKVIPFE